MIKNTFVYSILVFAPFLQGIAQKSTYDLASLLRQNKIRVVNREMTITENKNLHLSAKEDDGVAWISGVDFSNGTIEIDLKGRDVLQQSFLGIAFHAVDQKTLDVVYFRPFNFQSSDTVRRSHAVQYASHPDYPWALLRDKFPGKYEHQIFPAPTPNGWFHVKIVVEYPDIRVFINNEVSPSLQVKQLSERKSGKFGLWVGNNSDGDFKNLTLTKQ